MWTLWRACIAALLASGHGLGWSGHVHEVSFTCEVGSAGWLRDNTSCSIVADGNIVAVDSIDLQSSPLYAGGALGIHCGVVELDGPVLANITGVIQLTRAVELYHRFGTQVGTFTYSWNDATLYTNVDISGAKTVSLTQCELSKEHSSTGSGTIVVWADVSVYCHSVDSCHVDCSFIGSTFRIVRLVTDPGFVQVEGFVQRRVLMTIIKPRSNGSGIVVGEYIGRYSGGDIHTGMFSCDGDGAYYNSTFLEEGYVLQLSALGQLASPRFNLSRYRDTHNLDDNKEPRTPLKPAGGGTRTMTPGIPLSLSCGCVNGYLATTPCHGISGSAPVSGILLGLGTNVLELASTNEVLTNPVLIDVAAYMSNADGFVYCDLVVTFTITNYDAFGIYSEGRVTAKGNCDGTVLSGARMRDSAWSRIPTRPRGAHWPTASQVRHRKGPMQGYELDVTCTFDSLGGTLQGGGVDGTNGEFYTLALSRPLSLVVGIVGFNAVALPTPGKYSIIAGGSTVCAGTAEPYVLHGLIDVALADTSTNSARVSAILQGGLGCAPHHNHLGPVDLLVRKDRILPSGITIPYTSADQPMVMHSTNFIQCNRFGANCKTTSHVLGQSTELAHAPTPYIAFDSLLDLHGTPSILYCNGMFFVDNGTDTCPVEVDYAITETSGLWDYNMSWATNYTGYLVPESSAIVQNILSVQRHPGQGSGTSLNVYTGAGSYGPLQSWDGVRPELSDDVLVTGYQSRLSTGLVQNVTLLWDWGYNHSTTSTTSSVVLTTRVSLISSLTTISGIMQPPPTPQPPRVNLTLVRLGVWGAHTPPPARAQYISDVYLSSITSDLGGQVEFKCNLAGTGSAPNLGECAASFEKYGRCTVSHIYFGEGPINNTRYMVSGVYDTGRWGGYALGGWEFFETDGCLTVKEGTLIVSFTLELGTMGMIGDKFTLRRLWLTEDIGSKRFCEPNNQTPWAITRPSTYSGGVVVTSSIPMVCTLSSRLALPMQLGSNFSDMRQDQHSFNGMIQCREPVLRYETFSGRVVTANIGGGLLKMTTSQVRASGPLDESCSVVDFLVLDR